MDEEIEEFNEILRQLNDHDLAALHLLLSNKNPPPMRQLRSSLDGALYNAYSARIIVNDPLTHVQNEIRNRNPIMCKLCHRTGH